VICHSQTRGCLVNCRYFVPGRDTTRHLLQTRRKGAPFSVPVVSQSFSHRVSLRAVLTNLAHFFVDVCPCVILPQEIRRVKNVAFQVDAVALHEKSAHFTRNLVLSHVDLTSHRQTLQISEVTQIGWAQRIWRIEPFI
jgi:hypothetical protein